MKKLINVAMASVLGLSVVGVSQASSFPNQGSGTVTFKGQVIDAPCGINPDSLNQVVEFGDLSTSMLDGNGKSVPFSIKLESCDTAHLKAPTSGKASPKNIVKIAFTGATVKDKAYMLSTTGNTGVGITISSLNDNNYMQMNGTPVTASSFMNGNGEILLEAEAKAEDSLGGVSPGTFTAVANFALSYE